MYCVVLPAVLPHHTVAPQQIEENNTALIWQNTLSVKSEILGKRDFKFETLLYSHNFTSTFNFFIQHFIKQLVLCCVTGCVTTPHWTKTYSNSTNSCSLCNWKNYFIITKPTLATLNKRNELVTACRHRIKYNLKNFITCLF